MNINQPQISIIVPAYNAQGTIKRCINSLLNQTFKDFEIVVVEDSSTDSTFQILDGYARSQDCVRLFQKENEGIGAARNFGLECAKGKFIAWLDADDWAEPNMLERMINAALQYEAQAVVCNYYRQNLSTSKADVVPHRFNSPYNRNFTCDWELFSERPFIWNKLFSAELIKTHALKFASANTYEELPFVYAALAHANKVIVLDDVLLHHTYENSSSLMSTSVSDDKRIFEALRATYDYFEEHFELNGEAKDKMCAMFLRQIFSRVLRFRRFDNKNFKIAFIRKSFDFLDEMFCGWRKNPYYLTDKKALVKAVTKVAMLSRRFCIAGIKAGVL